MVRQGSSVRTPVSVNPVLVVISLVRTLKEALLTGAGYFDYISA